MRTIKLTKSEIKLIQILKLSNLENHPVYKLTLKLHDQLAKSKESNERMVKLLVESRNLLKIILHLCAEGAQ